MILNDLILDWFCLMNTRGVGIRTFWSMIELYKTAYEALKHVDNPFPRAEAEKILKRNECEIILANDKFFPQMLKSSDFCPPILYYKGDKTILTKRKIAIIGARNSSLNAQKIARNFASNLANNFAIVSGLARGIDTSAHIGSMVVEKSSIAVVPFGFDNIYPKENTKLFHEISETGLVLSAVPIGKSIDQGMFHARNRIIALMIEGLIVIEAAYKSGTMATATMALDCGCEIMVVPGTPSDPRNLGSNSLIKNGAHLIQNHFDVLEILEIDNNIKQLELPIHKDKTDTVSTKNNEFLSLLSEVPVSIDELSVRLNMDIQDLLCLISEMEIAGRICRTVNNEIILNKI